MVIKRNKKCGSGGSSTAIELEEWGVEVKEQDFKIEIPGNDRVYGIIVE